MITPRNKMLTLTRDDIRDVYDEIDRRLRIAIKDGDLADEDGWTTAESIKDYRKALLQGAYGALMAIVSNENWRRIVQWSHIEEEARYSSND